MNCILPAVIIKALEKAASFFSPSKEQAQKIYQKALSRATQESGCPCNDKRGTAMYLYRFIKSESEIKRDFYKEITKHRNEMTKRALSLTRNDYELADDMVQEAYRKAIENNIKKPFRPVSEKSYDNNLSAWLCMIVHNVFISYTRKQSYRITQPLETVHKGVNAYDYLQTSVRGVINNLPPDQKKVMEMSLEGFDNSRIADELKVAVSHVRKLKKLSEDEIRKNFTKADLD